MRLGLRARLLLRFRWLARWLIEWRGHDQIAIDLHGFDEPVDPPKIEIRRPGRTELHPSEWNWDDPVLPQGEFHGYRDGELYAITYTGIGGPWIPAPGQPSTRGSVKDE